MSDDLTVTKRELAEEIAVACNVPVALATTAVETLCHSVCAALNAGRRVQIRGLVSAHTVQSRERIGRNPNTGGPTVIPARRKVRSKWHVELTD